MPEQLRLDADAGIRERQSRRLGLQRDGDRDLAARGGVLDRVAEQVGHDLFETDGIGHHRNAVIRHLHTQHLSARLDGDLCGINGLPRDRHEVGRLQAQRDLPEHETGGIEQVLEQPRLALRLPLGDAQCVLSGTIAVGDAATAQQRQRIRDRGQRVAQLVRQHREEAIALLVHAVRPS